MFGGGDEHLPDGRHSSGATAKGANDVPCDLARRKFIGGNADGASDGFTENVFGLHRAGVRASAPAEWVKLVYGPVLPASANSQPSSN